MLDIEWFYNEACRRTYDEQNVHLQKSVLYYEFQTGYSLTKLLLRPI